MPKDLVVHKSYWETAALLGVRAFGKRLGPRRYVLERLLRYLFPNSYLSDFGCHKKSSSVPPDSSHLDILTHSINKIKGGHGCKIPKLCPEVNLLFYIFFWVVCLRDAHSVRMLTNTRQLEEQNYVWERNGKKGERQTLWETKSSEGNYIKQGVGRINNQRKD